MKKLTIWLTTLLLLVALTACSNNHTGDSRKLPDYTVVKSDVVGGMSVHTIRLND